MDKETIQPKRKSYELFGDIYRVRREARETWDNVVTNEIVYSCESIDTKLNHAVRSRRAQNYINGEFWLEIGIAFRNSRGEVD